MLNSYLLFSISRVALSTMSKQSYRQKLNPKWPLGRLAGLCVFISCTAYSTEPLHGPEVGDTVWSEKSLSTASHSGVVNERFASLDVPIPAALPIGMPFATLRYRDRTSPDTPHFSVDQHLGVGLIHHPGEGDPAWRLDVEHVGLWSVEGVSWTRFIVNLVKPYPWLKLSPSDTVSSWIGLHAIKSGNKPVWWIPEFAWSRQDHNGVVIDLIAPKHIFFGYRGPVFGLLLGAEQSLLRWARADTNVGGEEWSFERQFRAKLVASPLPSVVFSASLLRRIDQLKDDPGLGVGLSAQWIPNP
jgi:hypothetical protein